jgi:hypothetical protein
VHEQRDQRDDSVAAGSDMAGWTSIEALSSFIGDPETGRVAAPYDRF